MDISFVVNIRLVASGAKMAHFGDRIVMFLRNLLTVLFVSFLYNI